MWALAADRKEEFIFLERKLGRSGWGLEGQGRETFSSFWSSILRSSRKRVGVRMCEEPGQEGRVGEMRSLPRLLTSRPPARVLGRPGLDSEHLLETQGSRPQVTPSLGTIAPATVKPRCSATSPHPGLSDTSHAEVPAFGD